MNIICIVSNNLLRFKTFVCNLPNNLIRCKLVVVVDSRLGNNLQDFKNIYPNAEYLDALDVLKYYNRNISTKDNAYRYALGYKMILPWYIYKNYMPEQFVMLDDDIILTNKFYRLFSKINCPSAFSTGFLHYLHNEDVLSKNLRKKAFSIIDNIKYPLVQYVNGGQLFFTKDIDYNEYILKVTQYLNSDEVTQCIDNQSNWMSFYIDEVFFSVLYAHYANTYKNVYISHDDIKVYVYAMPSVGKHLFNIGLDLKNFALIHFAEYDTDVIYPKLEKLGYLNKYETN